MDDERALEKEAFSRLYALAQLCASPNANPAECLRQILNTALWMTGAHKVTLQVYDPSSRLLKLVAHDGLPDWFIDFFASTDLGDGPACKAACSTQLRDRACRDVLLEAGVLAVQSAPLKSVNGEVLGMVSTHFERPHRLSNHESFLLDILARQAAEYLARRRANDVFRGLTPSIAVDCVGAADKQAAFRILVVDDDADTAEIMGRLLECRGHRVRVAHRGTVAIEIGLADPPDVVVIDIVLPGMDGYEIARRMRCEPALHAAILIALSGYGDDEYRNAAIAAGFDDYLVKPASPGELENIIHKHVRSRHRAFNVLREP